MGDVKVSASTLVIEGAKLEGENPLPYFRNREHHRSVPDNGTFPPELKEQLGKHTGERYLPYRMQDRYSRDRRPIALKTIVLENDRLSAVFLPDYGGRLYSLTDLRTKKQLLYTNPVLQPANLAILNAWFSGGVEWNVGQLGHTFTTASPLHAAKLTDENGHEFLRMYEYERCKNVFWHVDVHLPPGAEQLAVYVRVVNDRDDPTSMYWWTNIAVPETPKCRVFSSTDQVIHLDHAGKGFGLGELPHLSSVPGVDVSYPMHFPFANEYFFQTPETCRAPWEAVAYEDGRLFYERSTSRLRYRKMFCWGTHPGGRRWCDFLSKPGEGHYIEIQGGLAPTQLHGIEMPAGAEWDFTQAIGMSDVDPEEVQREHYREARATVDARVSGLLPEEELYRMHERFRSLAGNRPEVMLHAGSGWGALERRRRETQEGGGVPDGFLFEDSSLGEPQLPWLALLTDGRFPDADVKDVPASWMVQPEWRALFERSLRQPEGRSWNAYMHYGVMLYEAGLEAEAIKAWETSLSIAPSPWVYRNLSVVAQRRGDNDKALRELEHAYELSRGFPDRAFAEEYVSLLIRDKQFRKAWDVYSSLPDVFRQGDRLRIIVGEAALELGIESFLEELFRAEFAVIREGEVTIVELWYQYHARKLARERNAELTPALLEEVKATIPPRSNVDFRLIGS